MFRIRTARYLAALLVVGPSVVAAQQAAKPKPSKEALNALVDSVVNATLLSQGVPSVSVAVVRGNETLVERTWGRANVAANEPAATSTLYAIGSNTKQFTAALILKLVERGRVSLSDSLGRHLTGIRPEWKSITIDQLLNHTAGLQRSYVDQSRADQELSSDSLVAQAAREPMASPPGTAFLYSNAGYMLLGVLVEKMYGKSYADVLRDEIAAPLGLTSLRSCGVVDAGRRAKGYNRAFDGSLSAPASLHPSQQLGAGGICSTAGDLAKWNQALHGGRVISTASYKAMTTPRGAAAGEGYGFGLDVNPSPWKAPAFTHGGQDVGGFVSENGWYPADSLSVTILYNVYPRTAPGSTHIIAALASGQTPPSYRASAQAPAAQATPAVGITGEEARRQFVGEYALGSGSSRFKVDFEEGGFVLTAPSGQKEKMVHQKDASFTVVGIGATVTFLADGDGRVVGFLAQQPGAPERRLRKVR